jgi:hypothetical protein
LVNQIRRRQVRSGPARGRLRPEQLSSDIPYDVDSVNGSIAAWQGLLAMDRVWSVTGHRSSAAHARVLALSIESALRSALRKADRRLPDGSLFVPDALDAPNAGPYDRLTKIREGSYWNLVMPYALAAGFFPAHSRAARGLVHYVLAHGSRLLGVPRADSHIIYSNKPYGSGLGQVYGLSMSRFMADNDHPDQLVLEPLRNDRDRDDARDLRVGRGDLGRAGQRRVLPLDVHAAELGRQRVIPRDAAADARPRAPWSGRCAGWARPGVLDATGMAREREDDRGDRGRHQLRTRLVLDCADGVTDRRPGHGSAERARAPASPRAGGRANPQRLARQAEQSVRDDRPGRAARRDRVERDGYAVSAAGRSARRYETV